MFTPCYIIIVVALSSLLSIVRIFSSLFSGDEVVGVKIMTCLLEAGADVNAVDAEKKSALHLSVDSNSGSSDSSTDYEELLINKGANIFQKCNSGRMPIHYVFKKIDS